MGARVFISHASDDADAVALAKRIHQLYRGNGDIPYLATHDAPLGATLSDEIHAELKRADRLVVVASSTDSLSRKWVASEIQTFLNEKQGGGSIVTVCVPPLTPVTLPPPLSAGLAIPSTEILRLVDGHVPPPTPGHRIPPPVTPGDSTPLPSPVPPPTSGPRLLSRIEWALAGGTLLLIGVTAALLVREPESAPALRTLRLATSEERAIHGVALAIANSINREVPGVKVVLESSGGSEDSLARLQGGPDVSEPADLALVSQGGDHPGGTPYDQVRTLAPVYWSYLHLILNATRIDEAKEDAGLRLPTDPPSKLLTLEAFPAEVALRVALPNPDKGSSARARELLKWMLRAPSSDLASLRAARPKWDFLEQSESENASDMRMLAIHDRFEVTTFAGPTCPRPIADLAQNVDCVHNRGGQPPPTEMCHRDTFVPESIPPDVIESLGHYFTAGAVTCNGITIVAPRNAIVLATRADLDLDARTLAAVLRAIVAVRPEISTAIEGDTPIVADALNAQALERWLKPVAPLSLEFQPLPLLSSAIASIIGSPEAEDSEPPVGPSQAPLATSASSLILGVFLLALRWGGRRG